MHDARVYSSSFISKELETVCKDNFHIIGDAAYPICPYLLTPYRNATLLDERKTIYNRRLSQTRMKIGNAFCLLKQRFRQLSLVYFHSVDKVSRLIMACCVMHNLCIDNQDFEEFEEVFDCDFDNDDITRPPVPENRQALKTAGEPFL